MNKLVVSFPGVRYNCDKPLLYLCDLKYESLGYDGIKISYDISLNELKDTAAALEKIKELVLNQLALEDLNRYDEIVFISKSFGTVVAGWLEQELQIKVRHLFLTPLEETMPYLTSKNDVIAAVIGTKDKNLDYEELEAHCEKEGIPCVVFTGVGHRLENLENFDDNFHILKTITDLCQ